MKNDYDIFIKRGLAVGFTDDQIDFLADWLNINDGTEVKTKLASLGSMLDDIRKIPWEPVDNSNTKDETKL